MKASGSYTSDYVQRLKLFNIDTYPDSKISLLEMEVFTYEGVNRLVINYGYSTIKSYMVEVDSIMTNQITSSKELPKLDCDQNGGLYGVRQMTMVNSKDQLDFIFYCQK